MQLLCFQREVLCGLCYLTLPFCFVATAPGSGQLGVEARCKESEVRGLDLNFGPSLTSWEILHELFHLFEL